MAGECNGTRNRQKICSLEHTSVHSFHICERAYLLWTRIRFINKSMIIFRYFMDLIHTMYSYQEIFEVELKMELICQFTKLDENHFLHLSLITVYYSNLLHQLSF